MGNKKIKRCMLKVWDNWNYAKALYNARKGNKIPIMSAEDTIKYVKKNGCSISRFGDGEFSIMLNYGAPDFQKGNALVSDGLRRIFLETPDNLLICLPRYINSTKGMKRSGKIFWEAWAREHLRETVQFIRQTKGFMYQFGDATISRPYSPYKTFHNAEKLFPLLKTLWNDRNVLIVEGSKTRMGVGNDLFSEAKSIKRILGPSTNAFDFYSEILNTICSSYNGELVILALGPTATILAADLAKQNIQALDLGHIDIQYEWFLARAKDCKAVIGKYTNEAAGGQIVAECYDEIYCSQIIARIGS